MRDHAATPTATQSSRIEPGGSITGPQFLKLIRLRRRNRRAFNRHCAAAGLPRDVNISGLDAAEAASLIEAITAEMMEADHE